MSAKPPLLVDIVADPVCPWCYVGIRSFAAAKEELSSSFDVAVRFRPYQLNPDTPEEGVDREAHLRRKFSDPERLNAIREQLKSSAQAAGFDFDASVPTRLPNTLKAHQTLRWAHGGGAQEAFAEALYQSYWEGAADIGDIDVLAKIAAGVGMDGGAVRENLLAGEDRDLVRAEAQAMREAGVAGVPTFIVNESKGFSGALPPAQLAAALRHTRGAQLAS